MNVVRQGSGRPLLLVHGVGGSWRSWTPILDKLARRREVFALDLPGHGDTTKLLGETNVRTLCDQLVTFVHKQGWQGIDAVGSSMGGRLVLEIARRGGTLGSVVALDPGGFWKGWQTHFFYLSLALSLRVIRVLQPLLPRLLRHPAGRTLLMAQLSARPWAISERLAQEELQSYATNPVFDEILWNLAYGEAQQGAPRGSLAHPVTIGWGERDRICFPSQAKRAIELFPDATLHWFKRCGHFPQWDSPDEAVQLILSSTSTETAPRGVEQAGERDTMSINPRARPNPLPA